jgi:hypothetical protein
MNTGVLLMNLPRLRETANQFREFISENLESLKDEAWDQGAFRRWDKLPAELNWNRTGGKIQAPESFIFMDLNHFRATMFPRFQNYSISAAAPTAIFARFGVAGWPRPIKTQRRQISGGEAQLHLVCAADVPRRRKPLPVENVARAKCVSLCA